MKLEQILDQIIDFVTIKELATKPRLFDQDKVRVLLIKSLWNMMTHQNNH